MIDHDPRFTDRAIEFSKQIKIDFGLVREIQGRTITLGDILAHSVPVNSFGQIVGYFDVLLGKPVRPLLESAVDRWKTEVEKAPAQPIIDDYNDLARSLTRLFNVRHVLCHESPKKPPYSIDEIDDFLRCAVCFTKAMKEVLTFEQFGKVPLTQSEMNEAADGDLKTSENEMRRLFGEIETRVKEFDSRRAASKDQKTDSWLAVLKDEQERWLAYRNAHCEFDSFLNRGGTIRPTLWAREANRLTKLRIADFESWLKKGSER